MHFGRGPRRSESKDSLDCNVKTGAVEGFEHDFGGVFAILGWIERLLWLVEMAVPSSCNHIPAR